MSAVGFGVVGGSGHTDRVPSPLLADAVVVVTAGSRMALLPLPDERVEAGEEPVGAGAAQPVIGPIDEVLGQVARWETERAPRWGWWRADEVRPVIAAGIAMSRCLDLQATHRLLHGGWAADPPLVWAACHDLDLGAIPGPASGDLFELLTTEDAPAPDSLLTPSGQLRHDASTGVWQRDGDERLLAWAGAAAEVARRHTSALAARGPQALSSAASESAAALLCLELERHGLPLHRPEIERIITAADGPRPSDEAGVRANRARRDAPVLALVPGAEHTDLRHPEQVRAMLASVGVVVPDTRKWTLEPHRASHPVVPALLAWRKAERIATTYGWPWLASNVGADDRLRGGWTPCDGGAGRMTAAAGLHNLPIELRQAVDAGDGFAFVRADLGQIEPRVLAAVSRDPALAAATQDDDLYAPVAARLGVDRAHAKIAVLAAMYGQTSGAAGQALAQMDRAYPVAMAYLRAAHEAGTLGRPVMTYGGRLIPTGAPGPTQAARAAHGRFARNAVVQGAAAELFKAWAATVRAGLAATGGGDQPVGRIVLCLHDELLVHVPVERAEATAHLVESALTQAARRWTGTDRVRFVADTSIVRRWSQAKA